MDLKQRKESSCACSTCQSMCKTSPCFPTPQEAINLVKSGYQSKLQLTVYLDQEAEVAHAAITGEFNRETGCAFQDSHGHCELHNLGLKPTEGRLAHHSNGDDGLRLALCQTWHTELGLNILKSWPEPDLNLKMYAILITQGHINKSSHEHTRNRIVPGDGRCPDCIEEQKFIDLTMGDTMRGRRHFRDDKDEDDFTIRFTPI